MARVLRLTSAERRHLYVLAGLNPPVLEVAAADRDMCHGLKRLIDAWMPFPAHIMDVYWNTVMYNDAAALVLGMRPEIVQNCLIAFFTDPLYRARSKHWEEVACHVVAQFRAACSECPDDEGFRSVVEEAKEASPEFTELWERRDIRPGGLLRKEIEHPVVGALFFESTQLRVPARPDLGIVLHTPLPEAATAEKLDWLTSPEGRRGSCTRSRAEPPAGPRPMMRTDVPRGDSRARRAAEVSRWRRAAHPIPGCTAPDPSPGSATGTR